MRDVIPISEFFNESPTIQKQAQPVPDVIPVNEFFAKPAGRVEDDTGRSFALASRNILEGVGGLAAFVPDLVGLGVNTLVGKDVIEPLSPMISETLTNIGLPEPRTPGERVASDVIQGATGGAGFAKQAIPRVIAGVSGATGGGSAGVARELGADTVTQIVLGLTGGLGGAVGAKKLASSIGEASTPLLKDIAESGIDEVSAFLNVRRDVVKNSVKLTKQKNVLFKKAAEKGGDAFIAPENTQKLATQITDLQKNIFDPNGRAALDLVSTRLKDLAMGGKQSVNEFQTIRRGLTKLSNSPDGGIRQAAGEAKGLLDDFLIQKGVVSGKKESVNLWNKAIKANRTYAQKFEDPVEIAKAVADETNEVVEQAFIGSGGASLNKKLANVYDDALRAVDPKQRKLTGFRLKQAIVNRMIKNAATSVDDAEGVSASRLANQIRNFRRDNQSMWNKFNQEEKTALSSLEASLRKEIKGGVVNRVFTGLEKFIKGGLGQNIELPRTLKPKTVVSIDDLLELTTARATAPTGKAITIGVTQAINEDR